MKTSVRSRKFRGGAYATVISFLVIIVLLAVNLVSGSMFEKIDVTATHKYSIADETRDYVSGVDVPIDFYYVTSEGEEDLIIKTAAELIAAANDRFTFTVKDPIQYPQFVYRYNQMQDITNNSIIVVNGADPERFTYIDSEEMKRYKFDSQTLAFIHTGYDAEVEIVKAIVDVTTDTKGTVYVMNNHNEWLAYQNEKDSGHVTEPFANLLKLNSLRLKYLNLSVAGAVPNDCDILIIGAPQTDLTANEVKVIEDYMTAGGTVILVVYLGSEQLPNFQSLLKYYGVHTGAGILCEGDPDRTNDGQPSFLLAEYAGGNTQWPFTSPMYVDKAPRNTTTITKVIQTSKNAYVKAMNASTSAKEPGDESGQYPLLLKVEDTFHGATGTMYVFASSIFPSDSLMDSRSSYTNRDCFMSCIYEQVGGNDDVLTVPETTAFEEALQMSTNQRNRIATISFMIPVVILFVGIFVFLRRRVEKVGTAEKGGE